MHLRTVAPVPLANAEHPPRQPRDLLDVLVGLCGQAQHEVELDAVPAGAIGGLGGAQHILLADVLVDDIT